MTGIPHIDYGALQEAKRQIRRATIMAERNVPDLHSLYKCQSALAEALGDAWKYGAEPTPSALPESGDAS